MPKIVDPEARRDEVVQAVFRIARRDGLAHASLRNVAQEAGLAVGSVRHYFAGHGEMMVFALHAMTERISARLQVHADRLLSGDGAVDRRRATEDFLAEMLPLDERRREECTVWLEFATAARTDPALRPDAEALTVAMRRTVGRLLDGARRAGSLRPGLGPDAVPLEAERLCALIDGLTLTAVLHPGHLSPETMRAALRAHLDGLRA